MKSLLGVDLPCTITFNKTAGTITIPDLNQSLSKANMLLIINATRNTLMMNFVDPSLSYSISSTQTGDDWNTIITFGYSTAAMADTDVLQIYVDVTSVQESLEAFMRRAISLLESSAIVDSSGRQRVVVEAITTAAVTNTTGFGPNMVSSVPGSATPYAAPSSQATLTVSEGPVDQRWRIIDSTQTSAAVALRPFLVW